MSNKLTEKPTSTTTPTNWFANVDGIVSQFTTTAFNALVGSLLGPQTNTASSKTTPADTDKIPLSDSAESGATKHLTWSNVKASLQGILTPATHTHAQSSITNLVSDLSGKAAIMHTHTLSSLTQSGATSGQVVTWSGSAWAPGTPSSGGSTLTFTGAAFVDPNLGNDTTGTVGDPSKMYATMLAGYLDGARLFYLSPGTHAGLVDADGSLSDINIRILGVGGPTTLITELKPYPGYALTVTDLGRFSFHVTTVGNPYPPAGINSGLLTLNGVYCGAVYNPGGAGNNTTANLNSSGDTGGTSGTLRLVDCWVTSTVDNRGGNGGAGSEPSTNGGVGGQAGEAQLVRTVFNGQVYLGHGNGGDSSDAIGGAGCTASVQHTIDHCTGVGITTPSVGGYGGGSNGVNGADTNLKMLFSNMDSLTFSSTGSFATVGTVSGYHNYVPTITGDPVISAVISHLNGTLY